MSHFTFPELIEVIRGVNSKYHKLLIIAGAPGSGKTSLLKQVSAHLHLPAINLSLLLSERLLGQSRRQRALKAEEAAIDVIDEHFRSGLCLDNTELLFDSALRLNPLVFLQDVSRNRVIIATWNGVVAGDQIRFGHTGHPDYFCQAAIGYPVVSVADEKLQLHLTA
ncbi:MAG: BREX-3 system P-loop-containing protein BrxF [Verrucomicrobia bacterium]|nr:BREX-3 system P-loop-containing protein BrxF [Verrucomicrobiota bacterium]